MTASLQGIPEFVAVAEAGGFTAAGRRLGLSKSLVSERITALEVRLGAQLLARTTRRVALTEAGEAYFERARRILDEAAAAEATLQELGTEPRGRLRVATTVGLAVEELAPLLPDFQRLYPHVALDVLTEDRVVDVVSERIDVALRVVRPTSPGQVARPLAPIRYLICAAPSYLDRHGLPEHPSDLARHACILYGQDDIWNEWRFERGAERASVRVAGSLRTHSPMMTRAAVVAGCGIGLVMALSVPRALATGELVELFSDWRLSGTEGRGLWAIYPANRRIPPKVRVFVDFVAARIRGGPEDVSLLAKG